MAAVALLASSLTGCASHHAASTGPTTTLVTADQWAPPVMSGPPTTGEFCTGLVAVYQHLGNIAAAPRLQVRQQIIGDYVNFAPALIASAPPSIAAAAKLYIGSIAIALRDLDAVDLNAQKLRTGQVLGLLLNPTVRSAGNAVLAFSSQYCHYDIGG